MPTPPEIIWWMLTGVMAVGLGAIAYLLSHWFKRIESTLESIWKEIRESRRTESYLMNEIAGIKARCEERHKH